MLRGPHGPRACAGLLPASPPGWMIVYSRPEATRYCSARRFHCRQGGGERHGHRPSAARGQRDRGRGSQRARGERRRAAGAPKRLAAVRYCAHPPLPHLQDVAAVLPHQLVQHVVGVCRAGMGGAGESQRDGTAQLWCAADGLPGHTAKQRRGARGAAAFRRPVSPVPPMDPISTTFEGGRGGGACFVARAGVARPGGRRHAQCLHWPGAWSKEAGAARQGGAPPA